MTDLLRRAIPVAHDAYVLWRGNITGCCWQSDTRLICAAERGIRQGRILRDVFTVDTVSGRETPLPGIASVVSRPPRAAYKMTSAPRSEWVFCYGIVGEMQAVRVYAIRLDGAHVLTWNFQRAQPPLMYTSLVADADGNGWTMIVHEGDLLTAVSGRCDGAPGAIVQGKWLGPARRRINQTDITVADLLGQLPGGIFLAAGQMNPRDHGIPLFEFTMAGGAASVRSARLQFPQTGSVIGVAYATRTNRLAWWDYAPTRPRPGTIMPDAVTYGLWSCSMADGKQRQIGVITRPMEPPPALGSISPTELRALPCGTKWSFCYKGKIWVVDDRSGE